MEADAYETSGDPEQALDVFHAYLGRQRDATLEATTGFLPDKEPKAHLYDLIGAQLARGGKGLRPALCVATCRAFGGDPERVRNSAAAIEFLHNAFLVHDDVEDGSEYRRGHPTMQKEYGIPIAVNVGDAMNALSMRPLLENLNTLGPDLAWLVFAEVESMLLESLEGQAVELGWIRDNHCMISDEDYLRLVLKKTCWYTTIHPSRIGALIATNGRIDPDRFNRFGYFLGSAFQIQDDILNLVGDVRRYGKEIGGDIREGKRTLMLAHLLRSVSDFERKRLQAFFAQARDERSDQDVGWVRALMDRYGSIDYARSWAKELAAATYPAFEQAYGDASDSPDKQFIEQVIAFMIERDV